ncbi:cupin domain-containing protein [Pseudoxanthomonas suwonensis]|uniref:cupin domain-containing protein n=1 Tax=Pseudoxanthomonas suwonensis TaxID=314722 RepID=UPI0012DE186F|nr:cupin domain-containing protein [Pseudoxanthomonas suwonensis]
MRRIGLAMLLATGLVGGAIAAQAPDAAGPVAVHGVAPADAAAVAYDAGTYRLLVPGEATGGRYAVIELDEGPGYRTPWHRHDTMEERYYAVEGTLTVDTAEGTREYPAGSHVVIPPGAVHAQGNTGATPVKTVLTITPAGFAQFFIDRAGLNRTVERGDPEFLPRMIELAGRHERWLQQADAPRPEAAQAGGERGEPAAKREPIGGQRDAHGCLAPAGFRWCARTGRCERPWELARERGFANNSEAFIAWCEAPAGG